MRRLRNDMETMVEDAKICWKQDSLQLSERIDAVFASVSSERNRRELANENTDKHLQSIRDMLSTDKSTRRSELATAAVEEVRRGLVEESKRREDIEVRRVADVAWLSERVEVLAKSQAEKVQDICEQMKTLAFD